jgi:cellulose synthase/poly-beta-1,6-N-acetylglucosamine synthase-like glycosyltransferase
MFYLVEILRVFAAIIFIVLALQAAYLFIFAVAGRFVPAKKYPSQNRLGSFVIYIPAYKEDAVIIDTATAAVTLSYPHNKKKIVVIADSLQPATLLKLRALPIEVVEVSFEKSTKAKALNAALQQTTGEYDYALILDADNVCEYDFLYKMNDALQTGLQVVQAQRVAKNTNTTLALLDAISEGINNHIFRKGHRALGLSCAIIGSGMALNFDLFKAIMPEITAVGGFDKEMELRLLRKRLEFGYAPEALVYDEKITKQGAFENQRRRWLSAQVHYLNKYLADGFLQLAKGNIDFFDKVVQTMLLPRILLLGIVPVVFILSFIPGLALSPMYGSILLAVTFASVLISIPGKYFNRQFLKAICSLPMAFLSMLKLLFKLKGANKSFIHTPHGS